MAQQADIWCIRGGLSFSGKERRKLKWDCEPHQAKHANHFPSRKQRHHTTLRLVFWPAQLQGGSIANPEIRIQIAKRTDGIALRL
ncbi:MAG: hypothetical protein WAJ88_08875 [Pseudolabrys sp.]